MAEQRARVRGPPWCDITRDHKGTWQLRASAYACEVHLLSSLGRHMQKGISWGCRIGYNVCALHVADGGVEQSRGRHASVPTRCQHIVWSQARQATADSGTLWRHPRCGAMSTCTVKDRCRAKKPLNRSAGHACTRAARHAGRGARQQSRVTSRGACSSCMAAAVPHLNIPRKEDVVRL